MKILDKFEEEITYFMAMEAKTQVEAKIQVEVMEEIITLPDKEEDVAETIHTVTIILVITWEGILVLSTRMNSVVCMENIHGAIAYTTRKGK